MSTHHIEFLTIALGLVLLMAEAFLAPRDKRVLAWAAAAGLTAVLVLLPFTDATALPATGVAPFYTADSYALFFKGMALLTTIAVLILSAGYQPVLADGINADAKSSGGLAEYYCLPVFTCAGLMWMASAIDLVFLFVALELVTISFYVMVASMRRNTGSIEAGVKYLILGALGTGLLVYGISWIFGATGTTSLGELTGIIAGQTTDQPALLFGVLLVLCALAFKVGVVPFHVWIPDVYQGAPTPTTMFLSVGSKAAGVLVMMRFLAPFLANEAIADKLVPLLVILTALTLLVGNLGAIGQRNVKRLLAYSSIGHAGFLMIGITARDMRGVGFYLAAYLAMTIVAFAVLALVRDETGGEDLTHFDGLGKRSPFAAFALVIAMASLAGVPLTFGFLGKLRMFLDVVDSKQWLLVGTAMIAASAGFYYYFKVIKHMYWHEPADPRTFAFPKATAAMVTLLVAAILVFGIYPRPIANLLLPANTPAADLGTAATGKNTGNDTGNQESLMPDRSQSSP